MTPRPHHTDDPIGAARSPGEPGGEETLGGDSGSSSNGAPSHSSAPDGSGSDGATRNAGEAAAGRGARGQMTRSHWIALALVLLVQLGVGLFGIAQPIRFGHFGFHVAEHGLEARNLIEWGSWTASTHHGLGPAPEGRMNFHHPMMLHPFVAPLQMLLGEEPWTQRALALAFSFVAVLSMFALVRKARGPTAGVVSAALFTVSPVHMAFGILPDVQLVALIGAMWTGWFLFDLLERPGRRALIGLGAACAWAALWEWPWYPVSFVLFAMLVWRVRPGGDMTRTLDPRAVRYLRLACAVIAAAVLLIIGQHFLRAWLADRIHNLMDAYGRRSASVSLDTVIAQLRRHFGIVLLVGIVAWTQVLIVYRRRFDVATAFFAAMLVGQSVYVNALRSELEWHEYRCYWFLPVAVFAATEWILIASRELPERLARWRGTGTATWVLAVLVIAGVMPRSIPLVVKSREQSGSTTMRNYDPRTSHMLLAEAAHALTEADDVVLCGPVVGDRLEFFWLADRMSWCIATPEQVARPDEPDRGVVLVQQASVLRDNEAWHPLVQRSAVLLLGEMALLDMRAGAVPSVEVGEIVTPERFGWLGRWLHYPVEGEARIAPADPAIAWAFAELTGMPSRVRERAAQGETPILDRLREASDLVVGSARSAR